MSRLIFVLIAIGLVVAVHYVPYAAIPFTWLSSFFHEFSHALATLLTGGSVERIASVSIDRVDALMQGGWTPLVAFAGFTGAMLLGLGVFYTARLSQFHSSRLIAGILVLICLASLVLWVRHTRAIVFVLGWALLLGLSLQPWRPAVLRWLLKFSGVYVIVDNAMRAIPSFALYYHHDGDVLARYTPVPIWGWAGMWLLLATVLLWQASSPRAK